MAPFPPFVASDLAVCRLLPGTRLPSVRDATFLYFFLTLWLLLFAPRWALSLLLAVTATWGHTPYFTPYIFPWLPLLPTLPPAPMLHPSSWAWPASQHLLNGQPKSNTPNWIFLLPIPAPSLNSLCLVQRCHLPDTLALTCTREFGIFCSLPASSNTVSQFYWLLFHKPLILHWSPARQNLNYSPNLGFIF